MHESIEKAESLNTNVYARSDPRPVIFGRNTKYVGEAVDEDNDSESDRLFIPDKVTTSSITTNARNMPTSRGHQSQVRKMTHPTRPFTSSDLEEPPAFRHPAQPPSSHTRRPEQIGTSSNLRPSRHSGRVEYHRVLHPPEAVEADGQDDSFGQQKQDSKKSGAGKKTKRASGANDQENIDLINMFDFEKKTWAEISDILNERRIATGGTPSITPNEHLLLHQFLSRYKFVIYQNSVAILVKKLAIIS